MLSEKYQNEDETKSIKKEIKVEYTEKVTSKFPQDLIKKSIYVSIV